MEVTRRCLHSVIAAPVETDYELVVVDDASPDESLARWLDEQAARGEFTLLRNERNLGFVASVNRGMRLHPERDVVLLNSDTEVAGNWLDRLLRCAYSDDRVATATPFSNNATICSYPYDGWTGGTPGHLGLAALDAVFSAAHAGVSVELPTAVGFCMLIRRTCLDEIGLFDEIAFGRGYGEENDFSLRAAKAGWRNLLCADTFVHHAGGVSFGPERNERMRDAARALLAKHPDYDLRVGAFIAADPVRPLRDAIDRARASSSTEEALAMLAERHLERDGLRHALAIAPPALPQPALHEQWHELLMRTAEKAASGSNASGLRGALLSGLLRRLARRAKAWAR